MCFGSGWRTRTPFPGFGFGGSPRCKPAPATSEKRRGKVAFFPRATRCRNFSNEAAAWTDRPQNLSPSWSVRAPGIRAPFLAQLPTKRGGADVEKRGVGTWLRQKPRTPDRRTPKSATPNLANAREVSARRYGKTSIFKASSQRSSLGTANSFPSFLGERVGTREDK